MIYDLLIIYLSVLLISFSFIGYGSILCRFLDRDLLLKNIGYIGLGWDVLLNSYFLWNNIFCKTWLCS
jgi:hypothetical protein